MVTALDYTPRRSTRVSSSFQRYVNGGTSEVKVKSEVHIKSEDLSEEGSSDGSSAAPSSRKRKRNAPTINSYKHEHKVKVEETTPKKPKTRRVPAKRIKKENGEVEIAPPLDWEKVYSTTKAMRSAGGIAYPAVVDTMGCERLADREVSPRDQRYQTLTALMLSSQTKDTVTAATIKNLQDNLPGGLCLESILEVDPVRLDQLIGKVGFHNNKTRFIKQAAIDIRDKFGGEIPDTIEGLTSLAGVGPKMGYLTLSAAWGKTEGIGVDVHVHRITNLWGWHKTRNPEETRMMLEGWLPRDKWHEINWLLVGFGQTVCKPVGRMCGDCVLAEEGLCPGSTVRRRVKQEVKEEVIESEDGIVKIKKEEVVEEKENAAAISEIGDIEDLGLTRTRTRNRPR